jgi:2,4-dienoyl-CoA reductase-like NADH-dependent reductase (Old Yellow Enzyme family)
MNPRSTQALFRPIEFQGVSLPNRIAMAPMTRSFSPGGVPGADVASYYRTRAEGGVGLIITEGVYIPHAQAGFDPKVPHLYGEASLEGWRTVVKEVHAAGGHVFAQLWHVGMQVAGGPAPAEGVHPVGTSMAMEEIEKVIEAFGEAAANAQSVGFDGIEIHGAHGYLIDQFFWEHTNRRTDMYGGSLIARTRFGAAIVGEIRRRVGPAFPIGLRFSQFKVEDYSARLAKTPGELDRFLAPLVAAGVDILHASTRRFWEPAFDSSDLTLAGWTKKLTGLPTIAVGSITLGCDVMTSFGTDEPAPCTGMEALLDCMERDEFDMIAVGRALIANPHWPRIVETGDLSQLKPFARPMLGSLT